MVTTEALCEASDYMLQGDTEKLKVLILDNIKTVGDLYKTLFVLSAVAGELARRVTESTGGTLTVVDIPDEGTPQSWIDVHYLVAIQANRDDAYPFLASLFEKEAEHPLWVLKALCVLTYGLVMKVEKEDL